MVDGTIERLLLWAAESTAYPTAPALEARVMATLRQAPRRPLAWANLRRPVFAALAAAIIALIAALAVDDSREAIARFFGIEGAEVERLPAPVPGAVATPFPTPTNLDAIGRQIDGREAASTLGFAPAQPAGQGAPVAIYQLEVLGVPVVVLSYRDFDLWVTAPQRDIIFSKLISPSNVLVETSVNGLPARWIAEGYHLLHFRNRAGDEAVGSQRTVTRNTLVWRSNRALYRLETTQSLADALRLASSLP